jgi:hypothetical protein
MSISVIQYALYFMLVVNPDPEPRPQEAASLDAEHTPANFDHNRLRFVCLDTLRTASSGGRFLWSRLRVGIDKH